MSVQAMSWALKQKAGSTGAKLVLLVLADVSDDSGRSIYAQRKLGERAEMTTRSLRDNLKKLEGEGLLRRVQRLRGNGSQTTDEYILTMEPAEDSSGGGRKILPGGAGSLPPGGGSGPPPLFRKTFRKRN